MKYYVKSLDTGSFFYKLYTLQDAKDMIRSNNISEAMLIGRRGNPAYLISKQKVYSL